MPKSLLVASIATPSFASPRKANESDLKFEISNLRSDPEFQFG
jgi:hypothetical protein